MKSELNDFEFFRDNQLVYSDLSTGRLDVKNLNINKIYQDVGSKNPDGYIRLWCNGTLRMKHRLIYFLQHGVLPQTGEEIDHIDRDRSNNSISNLRILSKSKNNSRSLNRKFGSQLSIEQITQICEMLQNTSMSDEAIAQVVGRSRATVRDIKKRRSRVNISKGYTWLHRE